MATTARIFLVLASLLAASILPAGAQQPPAPLPAVSPAAYQKMIDAAERGDPVDCEKLRFALAVQPSFSATAMWGSPDRAAMWQAVREHRDDDAFAIAQRVLGQYYPDMEPHMIMAAYCEKHGDMPCHDKHLRLYACLLKSLVTGHPGTMPETAIPVISLVEERSYLRQLRVKEDHQSLVAMNGHRIDRIDVIYPESNQKGAVFFLVDSLFASYARDFKPSPPGTTRP